MSEPNKTGERWFVGISLGVVAVIAVVLGVGYFRYLEDERLRVQEMGRAQVELRQQQARTLK